MHAWIEAEKSQDWGPSEVLEMLSEYVTVFPYFTRSGKLFIRVQTDELHDAKLMMNGEAIGYSIHNEKPPYHD